MNDFIKKCVEGLKDKKNVVGFSKNLKPKIVDGIEVAGTKVVRVYVSKKIFQSKIKKKDMIPKCLCEKETDVVEIGPVKIFSEPDKTGRFRPVELNVSVGNIDISAGSLGMIYMAEQGNRLNLPAGKIVLGSNAHVLTDDDSSKTIEDIVEKRIAQPGVAHQPVWFDNLVGNYVWHQQVYPSSYNSRCAISNIISKFLNRVSKLLHRRTTFKAVVEERTNYVDFALYEPTQEHLNKVAGSFINSNDKFVAHLFAGSSVVGILFGLDRIISYGLKPMLPYTNEHLKVGDIVKGVSFWGTYETEVIDDSAVITVDYGDFSATFEDVILVANSNVIRGGWSGSSWFIKGI